MQQKDRVVITEQANRRVKKDKPDIEAIDSKYRTSVYLKRIEKHFVVDPIGTGLPAKSQNQSQADERNLGSNEPQAFFQGQTAFECRKGEKPKK